jgi:hypothetical protein
VIGDLLVSLLTDSEIFQPTHGCEKLVISFTTLYLAVVRGVHASSSGIVSQPTIENLFPRLNMFGYRRIVDGKAAIYESLFSLIRSIYDKKFLFKNLRPENVWVIQQSVNQIPPNLNSFEIIDKLRRQEEDEDMGDALSVPSGPASPKLFTTGVFETMIEKMPHIIPFTDRVRILASALAQDKHNHYVSSRGLGWPQRSRAYVKRVRRDNVLDDGMAIFSQSPETLKDILQIEFISQQGTIEAGIDGGVLFK